MKKKNDKIIKILISLIVISIIFVAIFAIPTIADWGDFETYDSSSSYDSWSSGSSSSWDSDDSWSSSSSSWDWGSDSWGSSSSGGSSFIEDFIFLRLLFSTPLLWIIIFIVIIAVARSKSQNKYKQYQKFDNIMANRSMNNMKTTNYEEIKQKVFNINDTAIEDKIQTEDPLFNKAEFLAWASDMFVKLQYAWSDRNLENIRYFVTPELFEKTNNQVQRYIANKQINKLERVSVNIAKLHSFEHQGDRDILKVIFDTKMIDYIVDEKTGNVLRGDPGTNIMNPYILTFVRKTGVKTEEGEIKPVTMNCPNCGGATTILSSGKCPYCGSIITTRDNNWTLSEMSRYTPNS